MTKRARFNLTIITFIIGFMIAIQFKAVNEPVIKDTRDIWELRQALSKELEWQSKLVNEIRVNETRIHDYESEIAGSKEQALRHTLLGLKKEAGLTEMKGPGLVLTVEPLNEELLMGQPVEEVSPVILKRLVNELNMYGAKHIAIDGERLINTTVIRDINGVTKIGTHSLRDLPFTIKVITETKEQADKMYKRMQISPSIEDFFVDNLLITISKPSSTVRVPPFTDPIRIRGMKPVEEKGGD